MDTRLVSFTDSDYSAVIVSLSDTPSPPQLLYRLNTTYLSYPSFYSSTLRFLTPFESPTLWDASKILALSHAQDYADNANRRRHANLRALERQLACARHQAARCISDSGLAQQVHDLSARLDSVVTNATSRATLRARVNWLEEGEQCSNYFFSRFRSRADSSTTSLLRDSSGASFSSTDARRSHVADYYTQVYADAPFDPTACRLFLDSISLPTLSSFDCSFMLQPVTAEELTDVIRSLPPRKSPGPDGLPYEWYQTFAADLLPILLPLFNSIIVDGAPLPLPGLAPLFH